MLNPKSIITLPIIMTTVLFQGCMTFQKFSAESYADQTYILNQTNNVSLGEQMIRESRIEFLPHFVARRDFKHKYILLNPIKQGMIFDIVQEVDGRYLIWNSEMFNGNPTGTLEVNKDGSLASKKPIYSMFYYDNWDRGLQPAWDVGGQKIFQRMYKMNSIDYELIFGGIATGFIYLRYRELVPGETAVSYQEVLRLEETTREFEVNERKFRILEVDRGKIVFVVIGKDNFNGFSDFSKTMVAQHPTPDMSINVAVQETHPPDEPRLAFVRIMQLYHEKSFGHFYDSLDAYTKGKIDTVLNFILPYTQTGKYIAEFRSRSRFIHSVKGEELSLITLHMPKSDATIKNVSNLGDKVEIQFLNAGVEDDFLYLNQENGVWKLRLTQFDN